MHPRTLFESRRRGKSDVIPAFTLLEVVIVLIVLVAIASLVMPAWVGWLGEHRFREAITKVEAAIERWRAVAQRDGRVIAVSVRERADGTEIIGTSLEMGEENETRTQDRAELKVAERFPGLYSGAASQPGTETESKVNVAAPTDESDGGRLVCLLMPDGSAAGPGVLAFHDQRGRAARGTVHRWNAEIQWARVTEGVAGEAQDGIGP